jgi:DNA modification methylase
LEALVSSSRRIGPFEVPGYHVGNCLDLLRRMPSDSVHCCVTSPPYLNLRSYEGVEPSVWGGDRDCAHDWREREYRLERHGDDGTDGNLVGSRDSQAETRLGAVRSATCSKCPAWRGQLGLEPSIDLYVDHLAEVMEEVRRVLRPDATLWLVIGDSYASTSGEGRDPTDTTARRRYSGIESGRRPDGREIKETDLIGVPWMVAFALRRAGYYLRSDIVWAKGASFCEGWSGSVMPESIRNRPTKAHEYVFLLAKSRSYFYDQDAIREPHVMRPQARPNGHKRRRPGPLMPEHTHSGTVRDEPGIDGNPLGRNTRSVFAISPTPFPEAHFAVFPAELIAPMIKAGTSERGACPACGAPWRRVVERGDFVPSNGREGTPHAAAYGKRMHGLDERAAAPGEAADGFGAWERRTTGWEPSCACGASDPVPCVVLDPFGGSGTTGMVASDLGRDWLLFDASPAYAEIAKRRTAQAGLLSWRPGA